MDYAPVQAFLVGRCGKTLREAAMTSEEEYRLLRDGYEAREREEWEKMRWRVYMEWSISPNLKKRPQKPQDVIRFPWERETPPEIRNIEPLTEDEIMKISEIFGIKRENING